MLCFDALDSFVLLPPRIKNDCSWCTCDGKKFGKSIDQVTLHVHGSGYSPVETWRVIRTTDEPDGWEYGLDFPTPYWFPNTDNKLRCKWLAFNMPLPFCIVLPSQFIILSC